MDKRFCRLEWEEEEFFELEFEHTELPDPLDGDQKALKLSAAIHSDDLFMFIKRKVSRLEPETVYEAMTNENGELWLWIHTDSGFEGTTTIYYNQISVKFEFHNGTMINYFEHPFKVTL